MSFCAPHFGAPVDGRKTSRQLKNDETHLWASVCSISEAPSTYSMTTYSFRRHPRELDILNSIVMADYHCT